MSSRKDKKNNLVTNPLLKIILIILYDPFSVFYLSEDKLNERVFKKPNSKDIMLIVIGIPIGCLILFSVMFFILSMFGY